MAASTDLVQLGGRPKLLPYLRAIWERRQFALAIPLGELRAQNMDTVLGNLWHLLNPVILVAVYFLIFRVIANVTRGVDNFITFLAIGIALFTFTQRAVSSGARSVIANEGLIRSIAFPRAILPFSSTLGEAIVLLPMLAVALLVALVTGERPGLAWLLLLPLILMQALFNLGGAMVAARLADHFRDVTNMLPYFFRITMYVSGVIFPVGRFLEGHPGRRALFELNPMYSFVEIGRQALLEGATTWRLWLICLGWTVALLVGGFLFFRAHEHRYGRG